MDYKRQTAVSLVLLILAGMIFLVPAITDNALASTDAAASSPFFAHFSNLRSHLDAGKFTSGPTLDPTGILITWRTAGTGFLGGDEKGYVQVDIVCDEYPCVKVGTVIGMATFHFNNPDSGPNTCQADVSVDYLQGACKIGQGEDVGAIYKVCNDILEKCGLVGPLPLPSIPGHIIHLPPLPSIPGHIIHLPLS